MENKVLNYIFDHDHRQRKKILSFFKRCKAAKKDLADLFQAYSEYFIKTNISEKP